MCVRCVSVCFCCFVYLCVCVNERTTVLVKRAMRCYLCVTGRAGLESQVLLDTGRVRSRHGWRRVVGKRTSGAILLGIIPLPPLSTHIICVYDLTDYLLVNRFSFCCFQL